MEFLELLGRYLCCKLTASEVTGVCWVKGGCTVCFVKDCEFDGAFLRGGEDKLSSNCEMRSARREGSFGTADKCSRLVFNNEVGKGSGVGGTDYTRDDDLRVVMTFLVVIEFHDTHDSFL
jgi:hypothetical protein